MAALRRRILPLDPDLSTRLRRGRAGMRKGAPQTENTLSTSSP